MNTEPRFLTRLQIERSHDLSLENIALANKGLDKPGLAAFFRKAAQPSS
jgi:hypothetical protein